MAFCPETGSVFEDISVEDYVRLWCRIKQRDGRYYRRQGARFIEMLKLGPLMKKLGRELSKGQRRRVQTAIGFLIDPLLFMFDEPFDGLDVQKTAELAEIIRQQSSHMCSIISSHRMDVVERLADSVIVLKNGQVAASGTVDQVSQALGGTSLVIRNLSHSDAVFETLKDSFPDVLVCRIGTEVRVTGPSLAADEVARVAQSLDSQPLFFEKILPTLTDAMNYHLRLVSASGE